MWEQFIKYNASKLKALIRLEVCRCNSGVTSYTTAERDALTNAVEGKMVYNSTTQKYNFYNGTDWEEITSI